MLEDSAEAIAIRRERNGSAAKVTEPSDGRGLSPRAPAQTATVTMPIRTEGLDSVTIGCPSYRSRGDPWAPNAPPASDPNN